MHGMTPNPYFFIVIFCGVAMVFPLMPLALAWTWRRFFQPPKPGVAKNATYECGVESIGDENLCWRIESSFAGVNSRVDAVRGRVEAVGGRDRRSAACFASKRRWKAEST